MLQWNWIVWVLVRAVTNQTKVEKITKTVNFAQLALFVAKRATFSENSGTIHLDYLLLMLFKTQKDIGDARYTLQGTIATLRLPTDQAIL